MKKITLLCAAVCATLSFTGCKSSESAYKKAYEKAKAQEEAQAPAQAETPVVAPVVEKPATETAVVDNADNVPVRQERVSLVNGTGLKAFSVVVGSFSLEANALGLQQKLKDSGYDAQIARNEQAGTYRVIATTFDTKVDAASSRNDLRATYPDAWLLYNK